MNVQSWRRVVTLACDVVVVGTGAAGMNAAIHAAQSGASVVLLDKGAIGRSGASIQANSASSAAPESEWEAHAEDIMRAGHGLALPALAEVLAREASMRFSEWQQWGVDYHVYDCGDFVRTLSPEHSRPRSISPGYGMGEKVCTALRRRVRQSPSVTSLAYTTAVHVLLDDQEVAGLLAWNLETGSWVVIEAPAVVLATGGAQALFPLSTTSPKLTGDGLAIAGRAGAAIRDAEFVLYAPVCLMEPRPIGISRTFLEPVRKIGGHLLDVNDDRFSFRYDQRGERAPWEVVSFAIAMAEAEGGSYPGGTVVYRLDGDDERAVRNTVPWMLDKAIDNGLRLRDGVRVKALPHFFPGGIAIDVDGATSVPGLFAAGEASGGVHGASRLGGDAMTVCAVFGARSGIAAARRSGFVRTSGRASALAQEAMDRSLSSVMHTEGSTALDVRRQVQAVVQRAGGLRRTGAGLRAGTHELSAHHESFALRSGNPRMNLEFVSALEATNLAYAGSVVLGAAQQRTATLGAHFRLDAEGDSA